MQKYVTTALVALSLCFAACGGDKNEKPFIELPPENHPSDMSGTVEVTDRAYTIKLQAPTPAYAVKIESVWVVGDEIWVISKLSEKTSGMVAQVVTEISDSVSLKLPDISPVYYVIGKQIGPDQVGVKFIDSLSVIQEGMNTGEQVWPKK
ncbi:hypothetical protein [Cerasicoccus arenae]|uniref:Uncharacterized protein n=1 Tax=Cerasicoccus arenae TaxID=424488 RepID=A0A8J3DFJ7_9BACT|nr:hypothetical protein [Cerasicoccus arenae]MBK1859330.1 hypothetical protein [Cerasicoccus arenae]GHB93902.1 hypothetical protein GCM10007047_06850 [Cerasicoccus arenae]